MMRLVYQWQQCEVQNRTLLLLLLCLSQFPNCQTQTLPRCPIEFDFTSNASINFETEWHNVSNWVLDRVPQRGEIVILPPQSAFTNSSIQLNVGSTFTNEIQTHAEAFGVRFQAATPVRLNFNTDGSKLTLINYLVPDCVQLQPNIDIQAPDLAMAMSKHCPDYKTAGGVGGRPLYGEDAVYCSTRDEKKYGNRLHQAMYHGMFGGSNTDRDCGAWCVYDTLDATSKRYFRWDNKKQCWKAKKGKCKDATKQEVAFAQLTYESFCPLCL